MPPSSRTPEGEPYLCPICGKNTQTDPSTTPIRDAPCPHCGHLLVFSHPLEELPLPSIFNHQLQSRPESYEGFILRTGRESFGAATESQRCALFTVLWKLGAQRRLPNRTQLCRILQAASGWPDLLFRMEELLPAQPKMPWLTSARRLLVHAIQRVFAKTSP